MFGSKGNVAPTSPSTSSAAPAGKSTWLQMQAIQTPNMKGTGDNVQMGNGRLLEHAPHVFWIYSFSHFSSLLCPTFCFRVKGLTSDLIGQMDSTSDGMEGIFYLT